MKELGKLLAKNLAEAAMLVAVSCVAGVILYCAMQFLKGIFGLWLAVGIMGALILAFVTIVCAAIDWKARQSSDGGGEESEEPEE